MIFSRTAAGDSFGCDGDIMQTFIQNIILVGQQWIFLQKNEQTFAQFDGFCQLTKAFNTDLSPQDIHKM